MGARAEVTNVPHGGIIASHSGKCLAIENASRAPGARVVQASCDGSDARRMQLRPTGDGYHALQARHSSSCLSVWRASTDPAAQVVQGACDAPDATQWMLTAQNGGYTLKARHSGMCLDVYGAARTDSTGLIQYPCAGSPNQVFHFEHKVFGETTPFAIMSRETGQCVDVASGRPAVAAAAIQSGCNGGGSQQWLAQNAGGGKLRLVSLGSGMCLDVEAASRVQGAAVIQYPCHAGGNQQWRLREIGDAWRLVSEHSGMCLALDELTRPKQFRDAGTRLVQAHCTDRDKHDRWTLHVPTLPGQWSSPVKTDVNAAAAAHLPDGKILAWSAAGKFDFNGGGGKTYTEVLDPVSRSGSTYLIADTGHDMFCPGTVMLPDGRILVNGGSDSNKTSIYDPVTGRWSTAAPMNIGRGYQGSVMIPDGTAFTLGGSWSGGWDNKIGEVWSERSGWTLRRGIPAGNVATADGRGVYRADNQLWLQVLSGGRLLHAGPSRQMNWIDVTANGGNGSIVSAGLRGDDADSMNGSLAYFGTDRMLKTGGALNYDNAHATRSAQLIDAGNGLKVERVAPMAYARAFHSSVVLPTGHVMVLGGQTFAVPFSDDNSILVPEMWDPVTRVFERMPAMETPRNYHSVALLLADGRVWTGGGGLCGACNTNHADYQVLTPPYLLNADGTPAARPGIRTAGLPAKVGGTLGVTASEPIREFALIRLSSATHTVNNDQRRIALAATSQDGTNYTLQLPGDPGILLPGNYMLFAMNAKGVPSVAQTVNIAAL